jgi:hypothetical protein
MPPVEALYAAPRHPWEDPGACAHAIASSWPEETRQPVVVAITNKFRSPRKPLHYHETNSSAGFPMGIGSDAVSVVQPRRVKTGRHTRA